MAVEAFAPAKINLALHVTGKRADGYHLIDSLVVFAAVGDTVTAEPSHDGAWHLAINGPFALSLNPDSSNLVVKAGKLSGDPAALFTLTKRLPIAAGLGGGSSDAAAALRALHQMDGRPLPPDALSIGADVPVCLHGRPTRMRGIGEKLSPVPPLPQVYLVLVNAARHLSTKAVFAGLGSADNDPLPEPAPWPDAAALAEWLKTTRNDLEAPAKRLEPAVARTLDLIGGTEGCLLARMSGSGASCFGLYADEAAARQAAQDIRAAQPNWWVTTTTLR